MENIRNRIKIISTGEAAYSLALEIKEMDITNKELYFEYIAKKIIDIKNSQYAKLFIENIPDLKPKTIEKLKKIVNNG